MKKLLSIVLLLLAGLTASAQQEGVWTTGMNEGDELKGLIGGPYYEYTVKGMGSLILWDFADWAFKITTDQSTFDVWHADNGNYFIRVQMGLYNLDGKLVEKFENDLQADHIANRSAWINKKWPYYPSHRKALRKMMKALKEGNGWVRIVCKRRDLSDFDLKVTPYVEPEK